MLTYILTLLIVFQLKHFLADYPLQNKYMLGKFKPYPEFIKPLLAHASCHAVFTYCITLVATKDLKAALMLSLIDLVLHFLFDRLKASPNLLGRFKPDQSRFWYALGFDQMLHHLTHYGFIYYIVTNRIGE